MGARTYDPKTSRFLSADPIGAEHCLDLYNYANGDPINYMDPSGRFASPVYALNTPFDELSYNDMAWAPKVAGFIKGRANLSSLKGGIHGTFDFFIANTMRDIHAAALYAGTSAFDDILNYQERLDLYQLNEGRIHRQVHRVDSFVQGKILYADDNDRHYNQARAFTRTSLEVSAAATAIYSGTRAGLSLMRKNNLGLSSTKSSCWNNAIAQPRGEILFEFSDSALIHIKNKERAIPLQILEEIINSPISRTSDPKKTSKALMFYSRISKNQKLYNAEVLYEQSSNKILHFKYTPRALGPLDKI